MIARDVGLAALANDYEGILSRASAKDRSDLRAFSEWLNAMAGYAAAVGDMPAGEAGEVEGVEEGRVGQAGMVAEGVVS